MTEYTSYVNYGNMPLWKQIMEMYPWVDEENARRMVREGIYQLAKHVHIEAKKLKQ